MRAPEFWYPKEGRSALADLLAPLGLLYASAGRLRRHLARPARASVPVLCVGNLTAGGTGKTPVALALAHRLAARKSRPVFLTRGYGGRETGPLLVSLERHSATSVGDEALLLARAAPTIVAHERPKGASLAARRGDIIIMDDGFQNPSLAKDLSLLVIDGEQGVGNGRIIPAGPLREPVADALARADAIVIVGRSPASEELKLDWRGRPVLSVTLELSAGTRAALSGARVVAFAGIGRPEKFFRTLTDARVTLAHTQAFADHHPFLREEIAGLKAKARTESALLVTTEKDWVRIAGDQRADILPVPVSAVFADWAALDALLDRVVR